MEIDIKLLFDNHKLWENPKRKLGEEKPGGMASVSKKRNLVLVNLSKVSQYSEKWLLSFEILFAWTLAHEIFHINITNEMEIHSEAEEYIINKIIPISESI